VQQKHDLQYGADPTAIIQKHWRNGCVRRSGLRKALISASQYAICGDWSVCATPSLRVPGRFRLAHSTSTEEWRPTKRKLQQQPAPRCLPTRPAVGLQFNLGARAGLFCDRNHETCSDGSRMGIHECFLSREKCHPASIQAYRSGRAKRVAAREEDS
jgi:hypothetical protein